MHLTTIPVIKTNTTRPKRSPENKVYFFDKDTYAIDTNPESSRKDVFYVNPTKPMIFHHLVDMTITKRKGFTGLEYLLVGNRVLPHFLHTIPDMNDTQLLREELTLFVERYNDLVDQVKPSVEMLSNLSGSHDETSQKIMSVHQNTRAGIKYYIEPLNNIVNDAFKSFDVKNRPNRFWRRNISDLTRKQYSWIE